MTTYVNGVQIDTDKGIQAVINDLIVFGDGSTYNTTTGDFHDVGDGYVSVNGRSLKSDASPNATKPNQGPVTKSLDFKATQLSLRLNQSYRVTIERHADPGIHVELRGPATQLDGMKLTENGTLLTIADSSAGGSSSVSVISGGNISISSGGVVIGGVGRSMVFSGSNGGATSIAIRVPHHTSIAATITSSDITIQDVDGPLAAVINGSGDISASGASGVISIQINGSGDVDIDDGTVDNLNVSINGSGDVAFGGVARHAMLSVNGSGDIKVAHVVNEPIKQRSGSGSIKVKKVG